MTQTLKHYTDEQGIEHITVKTEKKEQSRTLDWKEVEREDGFFGDVITKSKRSMNVDSLSNSALKEGWSADTFELGAIESFVKPAPSTGKSWTVSQVSRNASLLASIFVSDDMYQDLGICCHRQRAETC